MPARLIYLKRFLQNDSLTILAEDKSFLIETIEQIQSANINNSQSLYNDLIHKLSQMPKFFSKFRVSNVHREPLNRSLFSNTLSEHIYSEQVLHVMSDGHWHPEKFSTSTLDPDYAPDQLGLQFRLPYVWC